MAVQSLSQDRHLGLMYEQGAGVPQDAAAATRLYRLAAERGDAQALYNLGKMYENGTGDYAEAARLYQLSADNGLAAAQCNLGLMYSNGTGVSQDHTERGGTGAPPSRDSPKGSATSV